MAVNESKTSDGATSSPPQGSTPAGEAATPSPTQATVPPGKRRGGAPVAVWLYLAGLVALFVAERVLQTYSTMRWVVSLSGLGALAVATGLRFVAAASAGRERRSIERLLGALSLVGLLALLVYFTTQAPVSEWLGLTEGEIDVRERREAVLTVVWVILLAASVIPMLFAEAALHPMRNAARPEGRRVRAAAVSGAVIAVAAAYCTLFVFAAGSLDLKADYSYFKTSKPSESTLKIAKSLDNPVTVYGFFPDVNEVKNEVRGYLKGLAAAAPKLKVEFHDRLLVPKLARKFRAARDGTLVLSRGETTQTVPIGTDLDDARAKLKTLDQTFQKHLLKVARSARTAYLTVGHGELNDPVPGTAQEPGRSVTILRKLLDAQNYRVRDLGLTEGLGSKVPDDATLVMVLGPTRPFAPEELGALERYVKDNGHLLLALDPSAILPPDVADAASETQPAENRADTPEPGQPGAEGSPAHPAAAAPKTKTAASGPKPGQEESEDTAAAPTDASGMVSGLQALARLADLELVVDPLASETQFLTRRYNKSDRVQLFTNRFSSHAAVSTLSRNSTRAAVVFFSAGSFEPSEGSPFVTDFAVKTLPHCFRDTNRNYEHDPGEKEGVFNFAAAVTSKNTGSAPPGKGKGKDEPEQTRIFAVADADVFGDLVLSNAMTNQLFLVDIIRWLGGEESFAGEISSEEDVRIEHTREKDVIWFYATIFGAPALVLGLGLVLARRSRRPKGGKR